MSNTLGKNIAKLRIDAEISQKNLAERLGITAAMLSQIEKGWKMPSLMMICGIADCFGCSVDELLGRDAGKKCS